MTVLGLIIKQRLAAGIPGTISARACTDCPPVDSLTPLLTSRAGRHGSVVLVCQLAGRVVYVIATECRQVGTEQAFLDRRHLERVDRRMIVLVAGHVDWQQALVRHRRQLPCTKLCHSASSVPSPTRRPNTSPDRQVDSQCSTGMSSITVISIPVINNH